VTALVSKLNATEVPANVDVVVAPTFLHIDLVQRSLTNKRIDVSAQNCCEHKAGAFTGELSADILRDFGLNYVILGHSERRALFSTSDETVGKQVASALAHGLKVIACIGETLAEREAGNTLRVCERQLKSIAANVSDWSRVVVAYEPVWAIGTGKTASPAQAQEVHKDLRALLDTYKAGIGATTRIIYGGSVKGDNADELAKQPDIDGFLVGGASLKGEEFEKIFQAGRTKAKL
jgi:triosephosphate isomerase